MHLFRFFFLIVTYIKNKLIILTKICWDEVSQAVSMNTFGWHFFFFLKAICFVSFNLKNSLLKYVSEVNRKRKEKKKKTNVVKRKLKMRSMWDPKIESTNKSDSLESICYKCERIYQKSATKPNACENSNKWHKVPYLVQLVLSLIFFFCIHIYFLFSRSLARILYKWNKKWLKTPIKRNNRKKKRKSENWIKPNHFTFGSNESE